MRVFRSIKTAPQTINFLTMIFKYKRISRVALLKIGNSHTNVPYYFVMDGVSSI